MRTCRNRAYTWQRISSWILLVLLIAHVVKFRFLEYPDAVSIGNKTSYLMPVHVDDGLYTLSDRLDFTLYDSKAIAKASENLESRRSERSLLEVADGLPKQEFDPVMGVASEEYDSQKAIILSSAQSYKEEMAWVEALEDQQIGPHQVVAVCQDFGTATLLAVRDTFKSPIYVGVYTLFVLAACFHAFNGVWTFLLTWGWILKKSAQNTWITVTFGLMLLVVFLGLASIWGTYWMNLRT
jgi:succinate dehydrogenase / fumarate reductase cytochrome b subunit